MCQHTNTWLTYCCNIKDTSIIAIAENCLGLTSINCIYCNSLTDDSVIKLAKCCKYLVSMNFERCSDITEKSIKYISDNHPILFGNSVF